MACVPFYVMVQRFTSVDISGTQRGDKKTSGVRECSNNRRVSWSHGQDFAANLQVPVLFLFGKCVLVKRVCQHGLCVCMCFSLCNAPPPRVRQHDNVPSFHHFLHLFVCLVMFVFRHGPCS